MFGPVEHPWFDPLWRRIALVGFCTVWTGVEFYFNNTTWGYIMIAITTYAAWSYLFTYKGSEAKDPETASDEDPNSE
ncbi:MAG: hypothetical protein ABJL55_15390 [Roseibium sp.]